MIDFIVDKWKTKAAFSAKLKKPGKLDLANIKKSFEGVEIVDTNYILLKLRLIKSKNEINK